MGFWHDLRLFALERLERILACVPGYLPILVTLEDVHNSAKAYNLPIFVGDFGISLRC